MAPIFVIYLLLQNGHVYRESALSYVDIYRREIYRTQSSEGPLPIRASVA